MTDRTSERAVAITAVRAAAALCERVRHDLAAEAIEKDDRSPVTIADFGAQAVVCRMIADAFPDDPIVGEEGSAALREPERRDALQVVTELVAEQFDAGTRGIISSEDVLAWIDLGAGEPAPRFWTLDPIDGTKGFLRGDHYAVALALIEDGEVQVAALACPALDEGGSLLVAVRGHGTWGSSLASTVDGDDQSAWRRLSVCDADDPTCRRFVESVEAGHANHDLQGAVARASGIEAPPLRMDSQAKYAALAGGMAALYLRLPRPGSAGYQEKIWDHAAGALIVEEAGGRVTDIHGQPLNFGQARLAAGGGVVASNGVVHEAAIEAIAG